MVSELWVQSYGTADSELQYLVHQYCCIPTVVPGIAQRTIAQGTRRTTPLVLYTHEYAGETFFA